MQVTFISQCEKRALKTTRRVLDSFASRIGSNTWQTVVTQEGLDAIRTLLRRTATKSTAVTCHWLRGKSTTELVWIVGNRSKFDDYGRVPVHETTKALPTGENNWHYLPLIKSLVALAALFHDWGKASAFFQSKLEKRESISDPLRHEWISLLFFHTLTVGKSDDEWLSELADASVNGSALEAAVQSGSVVNPLSDLPQAASLVAWLIVTHHKLPVVESQAYRKAAKFPELFNIINQQWGYECADEDFFKKQLHKCKDYPKGLPSQSTSWVRESRKYADRLRALLPLLHTALQTDAWRWVLHQARLALMLGDHTYSSLDIDSRWRVKNRELELFANTDRKTGVLKQTLDEHLVGVAKQAVRTAHKLPQLEMESDLPARVYDNKALRKKSPDRYRWQDTAVQKIRQWRDDNALDNDLPFGFFAINMASTGEGKTFANAKVMRALSIDQKSLRYVLALGLRTLTLQTGDEYRDRVGLSDDEMAVLIGSRAVQNLHQFEKDQKQNVKNQEGAWCATGSESQEALLDNAIDFALDGDSLVLSTVLTDRRSRQFLMAPVLACTIDHMMAATETTRGGRYILPSLRLMSSDLVIDEIDDFDGQDLSAIGRLIHLAGMLGRKVMLSSATIPPDLAEGFYNAYRKGWRIYVAAKGINDRVGCAWIDESRSHVDLISVDNEDGLEHYRTAHAAFVKKRVETLRMAVVKRKATLIHLPIPGTTEVPDSGEETLTNRFFSAIQQSIVEQHTCHAHVDPVSGKRLSFGLVRMANIPPCVELTRFLLEADWPEGMDIRAMAYHSQQVMILRHAQERHLDAVLRRGSTPENWQTNPDILRHLDASQQRDVIFILVATPVEEVGRDHDFDWAVVEPSSKRSLIQLAGRVIRHRHPVHDIDTPNIALLQYNLKGFLQAISALGSRKRLSPVFCHPGYESREYPLRTHDVERLVDVSALSQRVDAQPRIVRPDVLKETERLADLEHYVIHQWLTNYSDEGAQSLQGWLDEVWWLTAVPQQFIRFRQQRPERRLFRLPTESGWRFAERDRYGDFVGGDLALDIEPAAELSGRAHERLWLQRDCETELRRIAGERWRKAAETYGEISLSKEKTRWVYCDQLGMLK